VPDLHRLLELQDHDLAIDQLQHRRANLPERASLAEQQSSLQRTERTLTELRGQLHEIEQAQRRIEDEVATLDAKSAAENKKLNSGSITAPREIQALSDEIDALGRRKRVLEDDEIELMEKGEPLGADVTRLELEQAAINADVARLVAAIAGEEASIDAQLAGLRAERATAAEGLPDDLVARYERLRAKLGGIAVARLDGDRCLGCHVSLPAVEVDVIRHAPADAVVTHEDCGRILVR
jgi:predicted  nucleic acid-binding Zn-ribbon protein